MKIFNIQWLQLLILCCDNIAWCNLLKQSTNAWYWAVAVTETFTLGQDEYSCGVVCGSVVFVLLFGKFVISGLSYGCRCCKVTVRNWQVRRLNQSEHQTTWKPVHQTTCRHHPPCLVLHRVCSLLFYSLMTSYVDSVIKLVSNAVHPYVRTSICPQKVSLILMKFGV